MEASTTKIEAIMKSRHYESLASILDEAELQEPTGRFPPQWPFALHLASHIYASNYEDARFLYKRFPLDVQNVNTEVQQLFLVLQSLWIKDYQKLWISLAFNWSSQLQPLIAAMTAKMRSEMVGLVSQAYSHLSSAKLGTLLGLSQPEALQIAAAQGWEADSASGVILVKRTVSQAQAHATEQQLQRLAEYVVHLEG